MKKKLILFGAIAAQVIIVYLSVHYAAQTKYMLQFNTGGEPPGATLIYLKLAKWFIIFPLLSIGMAVVSFKKRDLERQHDNIIFLSFVAIFLSSLFNMIGIGQLWQ